EPGAVAEVVAGEDGEVGSLVRGAVDGAADLPLGREHHDVEIAQLGDAQAVVRGVEARHPDLVTNYVRTTEVIDTTMKSASPHQLFVDVHRNIKVPLRARGASPRSANPRAAARVPDGRALVEGESSVSPGRPSSRP